MTDARDPCGAMGPEVTALVRGALGPAEEAAVRAHLASCPECAALAEDARLVSEAAAARPSPAVDAPRRARLSAALDAAWDEEQARERARGPLLRLVDAAGRRYAESRTVRFFTISLSAHAAAAILLGLWLGVEAVTEPRGPGVVQVSTQPELPDPYPEDPISPPQPRPIVLQGPAEDLPWTVLEARRVPAAGDALDAGPAASPRLYPGSEFAEFARGRFLGPRREELMTRAYGSEGAASATLSVERGLRWLSGSQEPDGTWASGAPGDPRSARDRFRGGVTASVLLALCADGRTAMRSGPFQAAAREAVTALVRSQDPRTGLLGGFARGPADDRPLCNHGPALEALAEAYGLDFGRLPAKVRDEMRAALEKGAAALAKAQLADGSFGYAPGAAAGDSSVTLLQVRGLEAARRAGIEVDDAVLRRAGAWLAARVGPDGRLGYRAAGDRSTDATLSAEALAHARALGLSAEVRDRMRDAVLADARSEPMRGRVLFRTAALDALCLDPGSRDLAPSLARATLAAQKPGGAFTAAGDPYARAAGDTLATARSVRALTAPYRPASR